LVGALVVLITAGSFAAAGQSDETTGEQNETELTAFTAESQGGYVSFSEDSESAAEEGGTAFPAVQDGQKPIQIQAEVNPDDGTWASQNLTFPTLAVTDSLGAEIEVIDGLEGEIDPEAGVFTAEGEFRVTIDGNSFTYTSVMTSGESGDLSGSAEFSEGSAEVTLVDNEFTVDEQSGNGFIDSVLGLPADEPGENWLILQLDVSLNEEELDDRSNLQTAGGEDSEESQDTETLVLTVLGQAFGFAGLGAAVLAMLVTLVARVTGIISLDS
jgi:hypothetical protein